MLDFYRDKRIFLTGHTGFKGTWLCRALLRAGAEVTGYALEPPTVPSLFVLTKTGKDIHHIIGDVRDGGALAKAVLDAEPDVVFHMAAQPIVRLSYREPAATYGTNVMGTVNILEAARLARSVRSFVNVTTDKVYENREWLWGYREDENLCGHDPYSNSKSCGELVTYSYRKSFFHDAGAPAVSTARSGNVIGGGDYAEDRIIPDCVRAAEAGAEIVIRNPRSTRPYQHVLECLYGYLLLAEKQYNYGGNCSDSINNIVNSNVDNNNVDKYINNNVSGDNNVGGKSIEGAYNFGPDDESCVTNEQLADLFCGAWGKGASWRAEGDGGPHEANFLKLDCSKAKSVLGWKPRWDIKTAVGKVVEFAKINTDSERTACVDRQVSEYFCTIMS